MADLGRATKKIATKTAKTTTKKMRTG